MKNYKYEAVDPDGNRKDGIVSAKDLETAIFKILQAKLHPLRIEELTRSTYIAHARLEKLKAIKRRLEPEEILEPPPKARRPRDAYSKLVIAVIVAVWLTMVVVYIISQQPR